MTHPLGDLVGRARALGPGRRLLGITGPPGSGKTTLAAALVAALGAHAVAVPMDGFHLAEAELLRLGRQDRKGAPDTFDAAGYAALLRRLRDPQEALVYAPAFDRDLEEPVAGSVPVPADVPLVVTEGNYLLLEDDGWGAVRPLLDEVWYVDLDDAVRLQRLVARHVRHGRDPDAAAAWASGTDEANARRIAATRARADLLVPALLVA